MGVMVTGTLCWSHFEKYGLKKYTVSALSWMLRHSKIMWEFLLACSVRVIIEKYSICKGHLIIDDTDRQRSKSTIKIDKVHKIFDKKTGGYFMGQNIVLLLLVTDKITIPVGFKIYVPDPKRTEWNKIHEELRSQNVPKSQRPLPPQNDPAFPTKIQLALQLLDEFKNHFPNINIQSLSADALYGSKDFFKTAKRSFPNTQVISQLRNNQKVWFKNQLLQVSEVFSNIPHNDTMLPIRGGEPKKVTMASVCVRVESHDEKQRVVALKYEGEEEFRYIVASDLSWQPIAIAKAYSLRWLIEVFISDWKRYEGWGQMALQQGVDGSFRGVILSMLVDLCLLFHPDQHDRIENKLSACTVGSRKEQIKNEALLNCFYDVLISESPLQAFTKIKDRMTDLFSLNDSRKHMVQRNVADIKPVSLHRRQGQLVVMPG
jgi:hypothetical protein